MTNNKNMKKSTGSINYTRDNLFKITQMIKDSGIAYTITKNGVPTAVIIPADAFDNLKGIINRTNQIDEDSNTEDKTNSVVDQLYGKIISEKTDKTPEEIEEESKEEHVQKLIDKLK